MKSVEYDPMLLSLYRIRAANAEHSRECQLSNEDDEFLNHALHARASYLKSNVKTANVKTANEHYFEARIEVNAEFTKEPHPHLPGYADLIAELQEHSVRASEIKQYGPRVTHCDTIYAKAGTESSMVEDHIHQLHGAPIHFYPDWNGTPSASQNGETDTPSGSPSAGTQKYSFDFLEANGGSGKDGHHTWSNLAFNAITEADAASYFSSSWSISTLEKLRLDTIEWFYSASHEPALYTVPLTQDEMVTAEIAHLSKHRLLGKTDEWGSLYEHAITNYFTKAYGESVAQTPHDYANKMREKEIKNRVGEANDLFVWRLVVVHLRTLNKIGCPEDVPLTSCFDMHSLLQNVAHLLKYRRCVKWAKSIYKTAGVGSLHDQHRAKLLNKQFAHAHQDESDTEIGVARRMIRQAHVSNYVQYMYTNPKPKEETARRRGQE